MANKIMKWMYVMFTGTTLLLTSCAGTKQVTMESTQEIENPAALVNQFKTEMSNARNNQLNVLVPDTFANAEKRLSSAEKGLERGGEIADIRENVTEGRTFLRTAEEKSGMVKKMIPETIKARDMARSAGATKFEGDYGALERNFLDLTYAIETNDLNYAQKNQESVTKGFRQLELRAIKEKTLGQVRELIRSAEKAGAKKIVPKTYTRAENTLSEADAFISEQRYQTDVISKKADDALFEAERLGHIMVLSEQMKSRDPEENSIFVEGIVEKITKKLSATDMRNEQVDIQVDNILGSIDTLQKDRQFMVEKAKTQEAQIKEMTEKYQMEVDNLTRQVASLEGKTKEEQTEKKRLEDEKRAVEERLAAERRFNELYNEVRNYYDPDEAEVYKQGYQLVIRLKSVKFPVGKAVIMPDNYQLLSKVQRSIRTFGEPDVVIEGHTDSTGSAAVNEQLSKERAMAVMEYLLQNRTLPAEKMISVGYGPDKPLASNATAEGRAINRRIDVIIKPVTAGE
ncbi:MAG: OmpA family protein [Nitrospiraceae bacterium]|nr:MAG: OmpA family protein [Nitrospiraceae bacterium]